jgi:outer membrane protein OmpA-like peptidoglycan-associated protein
LTYIPKAKQKGPIIKKKEQDEDDTDVKEKKAPAKGSVKPKAAPSSRAAGDNYSTGSATTNNVKKPVPSVKDARDKPVVVSAPAKPISAPVLAPVAKDVVVERSFEPMEQTTPSAISSDVRDPMRKVNPSRVAVGARMVTIKLSTDTIDDPLVLGSIHSAIPEQLIPQDESITTSSAVVSERNMELKEIVEYEAGPEEIQSHPIESTKLLTENTSDKPVKTIVPRRISHITADLVPVPVAEMIPSTMHKLNVAKIMTSYKKEKPVKTAIPVRNHVLGNIAEEVLPVEVKQVQKVSDADGDGVPDAVDECPYIKGSAATHGCPDTDGDGVIDKEDHCPMEIGVKENYGCPALNSILSEGINIEFGNIEFGTGSAEVKGIYKLDIIEPALDSLWDNANYTLVLTGHTDNEGDAAFNMKLSQDRADVVKALFIKKGLDESRIRTVAYGETVPLRENTSEEGKLHNRRVEVHVIKIKKQ